MTRSNSTRTGYARNAGRDTRLTSSSLLVPDKTSSEWITLAEKDKLPEMSWSEFANWYFNDPVVEAFARATARIIGEVTPPPDPRIYQEYIDYLDNAINVTFDLHRNKAMMFEPHERT